MRPPHTPMHAPMHASPPGCVLCHVCVQGQPVQHVRPLTSTHTSVPASLVPLLSHVPDECTRLAKFAKRLHPLLDDIDIGLPRIAPQHAQMGIPLLQVRSFRGGSLVSCVNVPRLIDIGVTTYCATACKDGHPTAAGKRVLFFPPSGFAVIHAALRESGEGGLRVLMGLGFVLQTVFRFIRGLGS